jgi:hypothetical protein
MDKRSVRQDLVASEVKVVLDEIFAFCSHACDARQTACEGSAEWHKRTGEILAYARMTSLLSRLGNGGQCTRRSRTRRQNREKNQNRHHP